MKQLALDCIACRPTPRVARTEYSLEYHESLIAKAGSLGALYDSWDIDFLWITHDGFIDWKKAGRCTDLGHASYASDSSDQRAPAAACPFKTAEEVWAFDPVAEYGLCHEADLVAGYERAHREQEASHPNQLCTGGYYKTAISGAIEAFGWDMLLEAAADERRFAKVLERFGAYSLHHANAWAQTGIEAYIQHDDIMWTSGPFLRPDFYRGAVIPIYKELWKPLKAAGKKILFCSDGKVDDFLPDIAECGADGFIFEPCNDFDRLASLFAGGKALVGSKVDCRTLSFGTWDEVRAEIDATFAAQAGRAGLMFAVGNHIPANVGDVMCGKYAEYLKTFAAPTISGF